MSPWALIAAGILGAIAGSFLNALLFRYNTGRSVLHGRSGCMRCGHTLQTLDLVPLASYLILAGRCRYCRSRISPQYPLVEAAAALIAAALYLQNQDPFHFFAALAVWMVLLFIFVYDLRHKIIPWSAMGLLALGALVLMWIEYRLTLTGLLAGVYLALPLVAFSVVSRGQWMGWADGILEFGLGLLLGLSAGASALMMAFWLGAIVGILLLSLPRGYTPLESDPRKFTKIFGVSLTGYTMRSEVPFAPFLILGAALAYFLHVDFLQILSPLF